MKRPDFEVAVQRVDTPWLIDESFQEELKQLPQAIDDSSADIVLQICTPPGCRRYARPSLLLTYLDVSDLPPKWVAHVQRADGAIALSRAALYSYQRHVPVVYLVSQGIAEAAFQPRPRYRPEGREQYSFIFVGSWSFRKGVDILVDAFVQEFKPEEAHLHLHIPGAQGDRAANETIASMLRHQRLANISFSSGNLTEAWMSRLYNRHDCFVTLTRGEGWGMPIHEAMLCGLPVIAPFGSAMQDFLNPEVALLVPTNPMSAAAITEEIGGNFRETYGTDGITYDEPDGSVARKHMRFLLNNPDAGHHLGAEARAHMLKTFPESRFGDDMAAALLDFAKRHKVPLSIYEQP
jgi:glycosyltransferase involved in cell wall biosynthesis